MAKKKQKSQAEKTAAAVKAKSNNSKDNKNTKKNGEEKQVEKKSKLPARLVSSVVFLALATLFAIILFASEGALLKFVEKLVNGLIGRVGFIVSIPVLLYLFFIHAFSGKRPVRMRTACLIAFILLCSCISHLNDVPDTLPKGFELVTGLYKNGVIGTTGGVICGLLAIGIRWLCGSIVSYIVLIVATILMLIGGMGITVSGLVQAYRERPRAEWEDEEEEKPVQEPSTVVVNHIANKRIEYLEQKRQREAERAIRAEEEANRIAAEEAEQSKSKAKAIISQIDSDVEEPVVVAGSNVVPEADVEIIPIVDKPAKAVPAEPLVQMPPLELEEPPVAPVTEVEEPPVPKKDTAKKGK